MTREKYVIEARDEEGNLVGFEKEAEIKKKYPYLFSKSEFTIDDLCYYASYGQGRDNPTGPPGLDEFLKSIGLTRRRKYW
jgi:hypothetical protein